EQFDFSWKDIYDIFINLPVTDDYNLIWEKSDPEEVKKLLMEEYEFSEERVDSSLEKINKSNEKKTQTGLNSFF
ncbi:flap structure-specific endonuclease, partial [Candidatus Woesearchaeota archaeon]|nr:flap structure-specific endonuclease [Candidatus Woesearchaeota archaeon]